MAAQQAVDAALNHDLVSLQVVLQDVVANPGVVLATIHDVENNLLVQAGDAMTARRADVPLTAHSAPITLHDSIAGYVTITLAADGSPLAALTLLAVGAAVVLAILCGVLLYHRRHEVLVPSAETPRSPADDDQQETVDPQDEWEAECAGTVRVCVGIHNLEDLRQQLSAEVLRTVTAGFERLLDDVLGLYGGEYLEENGHSHLLRFDSMESQAEGAFRAGCAVWLLKQLARRLAPFPLTLATVIDSEESKQVNITAAGLWIEQSLADSELLQARLILEPNDGYSEIGGFRQPYGALLDRQLHQLEQVHV